LRRRLTPMKVAGALLVLALLTIVILFSLPSGQYLLLVDTAHPVAPFVRVQDAHSVNAGTIYFVDVQERKASELEALFPWIHSHSSLVPAGDIVAPCESDAEAEAAAFEQMALSQRIAAAVALRHLGYHVVVRSAGVVVSQLIAGTNAPCNLQPMDVILSVDGTPTPTISTLRSALGRLKPGDVVVLKIRRAGKTRTVRIRTIPTPGDQNRALVGFAPQQAATIKLPIRVSINLPQVGGPSAGLAFALEVLQRLGKDVTHGHRVAATGEMELNGAIAPIGGVKQKTYGVRQAGADVFLVPAALHEAALARRYAGPVRIIAVSTFSQALRALATLPPVH
jgi:PDZ domain-containing protein